MRKKYTQLELDELIAECDRLNRRVELSNADLSGLNLALDGANLTRANLDGANLTRTCLDKDLHKLQREFAKQCPPVRVGGRIVYRTARSQHVGSTEYKPGRTYIAPYLSASVRTDCHPGIYAASLKWMKREYGCEPLVKCYVRDGDWFMSAKGAIRCKRIRVLEVVTP